MKVKIVDPRTNMCREVNLPMEELEIKRVQGEVLDKDKDGILLLARDLEFYDEEDNRLNEDIFKINKDLKG
ncbi:hypothetical protein [Clostridium uliginosum]|uniref:Uncharacterized protein n=1 Tax=Clostridium uliginosum TaxID=119641 RepID=A0A1I1HYZ5_9CLOT|nr:hypothetical protein [Clostridium uliginosum]SFC29005.1 hypothetical protein SAMN05421842_10257 [Clostridium uliginosum]